MPSKHQTHYAPLARPILLGWIMMGFSLGGFFDGIVLHQVLQWHHLLSGLDDPAGSDLRFQIMADGFFHLFMYILAVSAAVLLVTGRASGARGGTTSEILRLVLIGFGVLHVVDALLSHWLLGLHRIRMDAANPLVWDLGWLLTFGIIPLILAAILPRGNRPSRGAAAAVMTLTAAAGLIAAGGSRTAEETETIIVFHPAVSQAAMMDAVVAAGAQMKWTDASGTIWAVDRLSWSGTALLHLKGAILTSSTPAIAGCLAWTQAAATMPEDGRVALAG